MLKTVTENYLLSPILDHKEKYDLGGTEIRIAKDYENNLRKRNCQFGIVEAVTESNPLNLKLGDIVFVNHFTFHGDIGVNRTFKLRPHVDIDGKKLFRVPERNIYLKYNKEIEPLKDIVILEGIHSNGSEGSFDMIQTHFKDRGRVIYSKDSTIIGKEVLVEKNALYALDFKDMDYYRIYRNEIVAVLEDGEAYPEEGRVLMEDMEEEFSFDFLDTSTIKKSNTVKARVIRTGSLDKVQKLNEWIKEGDTVVRFKDYGIKFNSQVVVALADDNIHGVMI